MSKKNLIGKVKPIKLAMFHTTNSVYKIIKYPLVPFHCNSEDYFIIILTEKLDHANIRDGK